MVWPARVRWCTVAAMPNIGNSFSLPFRSPAWFGTFALMGLIFLIPIVGQIAMLGWTLALLDNYRRGLVDLPPAGFQYLGRGLNLFVVFLVYAVLIGVILGVPILLLGFGSLYAARSDAAPGSALLGGGLSATIGLAQLFQIVTYLFYPAVVVATERGGIAGGLNPAQVLAIASTRWSNTIIAGLLIYAGFFLGGLGIVACCIGIIFTIPYGYAVLAGVVRFYEASLEGPATTPPPQPPPPGFA
jgi:hypothetical protein